MDESIPDQITVDEWKGTHKLAKELLGPRFDEYMEAAAKALKTVKKETPLTTLVIENTNKILQENQVKIMMLRAAAYQILQDRKN